MKVAVTYDNGQIFQHFGHTQQLKIYTVLDGKLVADVIIDTGENGHGAMAGLLKDLRVDVLICGGIGGGAKNALNAAGIEFYPYVQGTADDAVKAFLAGTLVYDLHKSCAHHGDHDHAEGHNCGAHNNIKTAGCGHSATCDKHNSDGSRKTDAEPCC